MENIKSIDFIFPMARKLRALGKCPFCGKMIDEAQEFRNDISRTEYKISGICQGCQDKTFGED